MALSEDRILVSIELDLVAYAINVLWRDRVLRDGVVISEGNHRGAYPVDASGNVDGNVQTLLGSSLKEIIGVAADGAQKNLVAANDLISELRSLLSVASDRVSELEALLATSQESHAVYKAESERLAILLSSVEDVLGVANARIAELEAIDAGAE